MVEGTSGQSSLGEQRRDPTVGDTLRRYWLWVALVVGSNVLIYLLVNANLGHLEFRDRWPLRIATGSVLLLFDNLLVLWWYAHRTEQQARTSHALFTIAHDQFNLTRAQHDAAERREADRQKPAVVIEWRFAPAPRFELPAGWSYVVRNLGPGRAFGVVLVLHGQTGASQYQLGTLDPGDENRLPQDVINWLNQNVGNTVFLVATNRSHDGWFITENRVVNSQMVVHRFGELSALSEEERRATASNTIGDYLSREWVRFQYATKFAGCLHS